MDRIKFKEISIIIPCYNEAQRIESTVKRIMDDLRDVAFFELVLVDDGSTDDTFQALKRIYYNYSGFIRVLSYNKNWGKGHAVYQGIDMSVYPIKLILDADYSVSARYIKNIDFKGYPQQFIVKGQRQQVRRQPIYRIILGKAWQVLVWLMTGLNMDTQCPFTLLRFKKKDYKELHINGFAFDVELLYLAKRKNYLIMPYPVRYYNTKDSKVTITKTIEMFWDLLRIRKKK